MSGDMINQKILKKSSTLSSFLRSRYPLELAHLRYLCLSFSACN